MQGGFFRGLQAVAVLALTGALASCPQPTEPPPPPPPAPYVMPVAADVYLDAAQRPTGPAQTAAFSLAAGIPSSLHQAAPLAYADLPADQLAVLTLDDAVGLTVDAYDAQWRRLNKETWVLGQSLLVALPGDEGGDTARVWLWSADAAAGGAGIAEVGWRTGELEGAASLDVGTAFRIQVDLGPAEGPQPPRDLVFLFSSTRTDTRDYQSAPWLAHGNVGSGSRSLSSGPPASPAGFDRGAPPPASPRRSRDFSRSRPSESDSRSLSGPETALPPDPTVGTTTWGYWAENQETGVWRSVPTTLRYRSGSPVETSQGPRTLQIWVEDAWWSSEAAPGSHGRVVASQVEGLAAQFLAPGADNDIYDWVTDLFGPEWGDQRKTGTLPADISTLDIVLYDIDGDGSGPFTEGGSYVLGYFWSLNNLTSDADSNQRLLFTLDAPALGYPEDQEERFRELTSTLAHEFQHMVHYYNKGLRNAPTDTWFNEMLSLVTEDLLADRLGIEGPRGTLEPLSVAAGPGEVLLFGRLALYNYFFEAPLIDWWHSASDTTANYSSAYAFGAWLVRNYGGAGLLRDLMADRGTGPSAFRVREVLVARDIEFPLSWGELVRNWAWSGWHSDRSGQATGYRYRNSNDGWFEAAEPFAHKYGSIDLWAYPRYNFSSDQLGPNGPFAFPLIEGSTAYEGFLPTGFGPGTNLPVRALSANASRTDAGRGSWVFQGTRPEGALVSVILR